MTAPDPEQATMDGPNTHRYPDAHFVTSWTLFRLPDPDGVEHVFHVPTRIVDQFRIVEEAAALATPPEPPVSPEPHNPWKSPTSEFDAREDASPPREAQIERIAAALQRITEETPGSLASADMENGEQGIVLVASWFYDAGLRAPEPAKPPQNDHVHLGEWCSPCVLQGRAYERNLAGTNEARATPVSADRHRLAAFLTEALDRHGTSYRLPKRPADLAYALADELATYLSVCGPGEPPFLDDQTEELLLALFEHDIYSKGDLESTLRAGKPE